MANTDSSAARIRAGWFAPLWPPQQQQHAGFPRPAWDPADSCLQPQLPAKQTQARNREGKALSRPGCSAMCFWNLYDLETSYANTARAGKVPREGPRSTGHGAPFGPSPTPTQAAQALPAPHQAMSSCAGPAGIIPTRVRGLWLHKVAQLEHLCPCGHITHPGNRAATPAALSNVCRSCSNSKP